MTTIWSTPDLRARWARAITTKIVDYFERLAGAPNPDAFKTKHQHHEDTHIPLKHIDRRDGSLVDFLEAVGLIRLERRGELFRVTPMVPVSAFPPDEVKLPTYASTGRKRSVVDRKRVYELDGGVCAYCGQYVALSDCVIDHIYPFNKGGADDERNLTVQCRKCRKWHAVPGDGRWIDPIRFRGKTVKSVKFVEDGGFKYPVFECAGEE